MLIPYRLDLTGKLKAMGSTDPLGLCVLCSNIYMDPVSVIEAAELCA